MMNILSRRLAALLGAACMAEGFYFGARSARMSAPAEEFSASHDRWAAELENLERRPAPLHQEEREPLLGKTLEGWVQARALASGIRSEIFTTDKEIVVSFKIPGLKAESLKISINSVRVTISFIADLIVETRDAYGSYRREAVRRYEMIMPLPANADACRHRVIQEGGAFKIIFEKSEDPSLKS